MALPVVLLVIFPVTRQRPAIPRDAVHLGFDDPLPA